MSQIISPDVFYEISQHLDLQDVKQLKLVCKNCVNAANKRINEIRFQVFSQFKNHYEEYLIEFKISKFNLAVMSLYATSNKRAKLFYQVCLDSQVRIQIPESRYLSLMPGKN